MKKFLYYFFIFALAAVFAYSGYNLLTYYTESAETEAVYDDLSQLRQEALVTAPTQPEKPNLPADSVTEPTEPADPNEGLVMMTHPQTGQEVWMRPEFTELFTLNPDIIGWITVEGTKVDYPVVHRPGDKDYYLHRDFYGYQRARGCIYAREVCDALAPSDNIIIYGHMMKDNSMFASLNSYKEKSFWERHPYIRFDTLRQTGLYEIICVFKTSATLGKGFRYHTYIDFDTPEQLTEFWKEATSRAYYDTGLEPQFGDKLITLSTCEYTLENGRLVIVARRIGSP